MALWSVALALLWPSLTLAQTARLADDALPGLGELPTALPPARLTTAASAGYGYTGEVLKQNDAHHRLGLGLAAAYAHWPEAAIGVRVRGRHDQHRGTGSRGSQGVATSGQLTLRGRVMPLEHVHLGAELRTTLPPAENPRRSFKATTPEVSTLATWTRGGLAVSGQVGLRINRSHQAFSSTIRLNANERLALGASDDAQLLLGAGIQVPLGPLEGFGELRYMPLVGSGAPEARHAPLVLGAGARADVLPVLQVGGRVGLALNPHPAPAMVVEQPIPPRLWLQATVAVNWDRRRSGASRPESAPPAQPPAPSQPDEASPSPVEGQVTGPHGAALQGARVTLQQDEQTHRAESDAQGRFQIPQVSPGTWTLRADVEGYEPLERELQVPASEPLVLRLKRALPPGQIQVRVQDFRGQRVDARVVLTGDARTFEPHPEPGTYTLDLPPGEYEIEVVADGYAPQRRSAVVEENGVTIIVVDVRREAQP